MTTPPGPLEIDPSTWPRRDIYAHYRGLGFPYLAVTAEVDATRLVGACREAGVSLFAAMLQQLALAANAVAPLRQRIRVVGGRDVVLEHAAVDPGFTVAADDGLFSFTSVPLDADLGRFAAAVADQSAARRGEASLGAFDAVRDDLLYLSCLPWVRFTSLLHPVALDRPDTVPRIAWGRLTDEAGTWRCPVNLQAHHALVDGQHVGAFFQTLQQGLDGFAVAGS